MMHSLLLAVVICLTTVSIQGISKPLQRNHEVRLYEHLMNKYYDLNSYGELRPLTTVPGTIHVQFGIAIIKFQYFDEETKVASFQTIERYMWQDQFLAWDPADHGGITDMRIPIKIIWKPDVTLYNAFAPSERVADALAVVSSNGTVIYMPMVYHKVSCWAASSDVECSMKFGSWVWDGSKMNIEFYEGLEEADLSDYIFSNDFNLESSNGQKNLKYYPCCQQPYPDLTFTLAFKRETSWLGMLTGN